MLPPLHRTPFVRNNSFTSKIPPTTTPTSSTALSRLSCLDVLFGSLGCTSASVDVVPVPFSPNDAAATNAVSYDCCPCLPAAPVIVASLPPIGRHRMLVRPGRPLIGPHNPAGSSLVDPPPTRLTGNAKMHRKATEQLQAAGD